MLRLSINLSKVEVSATLRKNWFYGEHISIKSDIHTNNIYLNNKLNDVLGLDKGFVLEVRTTAEGSLIMINLFSLYDGSRVFETY